MGFHFPINKMLVNNHVVTVDRNYFKTFPPKTSQLTSIVLCTIGIWKSE